jgi:hypothetical protein
MSGVLQIQRQNEEILTRLKKLEEGAASQSKSAAESATDGGEEPAEP